MARFQAGCEGRGYEVTRLGTTGTGADGFAAGWRGRVTVRAYSDEERDRYSVRLGPHMYSGGRTWTLASGRLDAYRNPAPDVAPSLVRLLAYMVEDSENEAVDAQARLGRARELAEAADGAEADALAAVAVALDRGVYAADGDRLAAAHKAQAVAGRAVKVAVRAARRAKAEARAAWIAWGHAKRAAAKLEDADTGAATVDRLGVAAYEAENEAAAALDAYIAAHGPEPEAGGGGLVASYGGTVIARLAGPDESPTG